MASSKELNIPIKGYSEGLPPHIQPQLTTGYMDNMFPRGTLEKKIRLTQRPGLDKTFAAQIGGAADPIVCLLSVTTVS